ncbi:MAG: LPS export ABC transporter periplasmic protein LptC [Saprospiraceae bacterium]|nr:LPS export ABC transporter periplasmic protein LptC [Saprospiraceae bacterium]
MSDQEAVELLDKEYLTEVELIYTDTGKLILRVIAPVMIRHYKQGASKDEFPNGMKAIFYSNGEITNILHSKYAIRVPEEGKTYLSENVVLDNPKGEKLETSELVWDERARKVYTYKFVRLSRDQEVIHAYGFESDQNFTKGLMLSTEARFPSKKILGEIDEEKEE